MKKHTFLWNLVKVIGFIALVFWLTSMLTGCTIAATKPSTGQSEIVQVRIQAINVDSTNAGYSPVAVGNLQ
jgi:hypothetical protein